MHLYLHIPFCRQACYYCDFHFSTNLTRKADFVAALNQEIAMQRNYLPSAELRTIYFGGGTPSLLSASELTSIMDTIRTHFRVLPEVEISMEVNPDDMSAENLRIFKANGINRLSVGIQSFNDVHLKSMNRLHTGGEAKERILLAKEIGIENISADLIYAIPAPDHSILENDLDTMIGLGLKHISAYCLTIEPDTVFGRWVQAKKMAPIEDEFSAEQFQITAERLANAGYEQYEISNFAKEEAYSRHNTAYWQRKPYLGVGPSAHSYNRNSRQYNVSNNNKYIQSITEGVIPATVEVLSAIDEVNEYLLTGLRTQWGCSLVLLDQLSEGTFREKSRDSLKEMMARGWIHIYDDHIRLTESGRLFADGIASDLFFE